MPGNKSQAGSRPRSKQEPSKDYLGSVKSNESLSKLSIWPKWDIEIEKQDQTSGKARDRAKASHVPTLYEDPEGILLPPSLSSMGVVCWKRPSEVGALTGLSSEEVCVVNDIDSASIDLLSNNTHILHSKFISWMVSEVGAMWKVRDCLVSGSGEEEPRLWSPWAHIYPHNKAALATAMGKYSVKLFWMGSWRKITVDDYLPFLDQNKSTDAEEVPSPDRYQPLYPRTGNLGEIWLALLMKALLKVAALDAMCEEFGDFSVTHLLTSWVPNVVTLEPHKGRDIWKDQLLPSLPLWVRDRQENEQSSRNCIVLACFKNLEEQEPPKRVSVSLRAEATIEAKLKEVRVLPLSFDQTFSPVFPLLLTQARDEPLIPPPNTPPPPVLQFPFYLGLTKRQRTNDIPLSSLTPDDPWFLEIVPREIRDMDNEEELEEGKGGAVWIDYSDFLKCFSHLYVFKNPSSFVHRSTHVNLSKTVQEQNLLAQTRKGASSAQLISSTKALTPTENNILFVDSPHPILLHFALSALCNWRQGGKNTHTVPLKTPFPKQQDNEAVVPGQLVVDSFQWDSIQTSAPLLRLKTTGTKGATLNLAPGRHVLRLHLKSPVAHHLTVFSNAEFQLTDKDNIYTFLNKESSLYMSYCLDFINTLIEASKHFGDCAEELKTNLRPLGEQFSEMGISRYHCRMFLASVLETWSAHSKECGLTDHMIFAWKSFFLKSFALLEQGLPQSENNSSMQLIRRSFSKRGQLESKQSAEEKSEATEEENEAASRITRSLQSSINAKRRRSMTPGTPINEKAAKGIEKSISSLEPHLNTLSTEIFGNVFELEPSLKSFFPFHNDENERCFSTLYTGTLPPLAPNAWVLILRAVFRVPTPQTVVPHFSCHMSSYLLRVINNDMMAEVPRVFHNTTPVTYTPNIHGYTVQVEAWCGDVEGVEGGGKWGLRLVSSSPEQPVIDGGEEGALVTPHTQELMDYCLPDRDNVLFRYTLSSSKDLPVSLQLRVSKQEAYCKLQLLKDEEPVSEVDGRKTCVLPLYYLEAPKEEDKPHKYVVQAVVLRDSWPTADTAWPHISVIRSSEKQDQEKPGSAKKGRSKGAASKKSYTSYNGQMGHNVDTCKPHWLLRVASNLGDKDQLVVAKDTEEADKLQAMVQAWETEEPGRSKKALESRKKFLKARGISDEQLASEEQVPTGPLKIKQMDLSPFIINDGPPHLLDEAEKALRLQERQRLFKAYRSERQSILEKRNEDREARNEAKVKQLKQAETWQIQLDRLRNKVNAGREAIRERHLKKEKAKQEAEQSAHEERVPSAADKDTKGAKSKSGKGKKK